MFIECKYSLGQIVYLKTDEDQKARMVTIIKIEAENVFSYDLACSDVVSAHYECEISEKKDFMLT